MSRALVTLLLLLACRLGRHDWVWAVAWNDRDYVAPLMLLDVRGCRRCGALKARWRVRGDWKILSLLLAVFAGAGCAAHNAGGGSLGAGDARRPSVALPNLRAAALADSFTLSYTAPAFRSWGCAPDTTRPLRDTVRVAVLRLRGQAAAYRPGCEAAVACWDSVRAQTAPDTTWRRGLWPGQRDSLRVGAGQYVAIPFTAGGPSRCGWQGRIVVTP